MTKMGLCALVLGCAAGCAVRAAPRASPVSPTRAEVAAKPAWPVERIRFFESGVAEFRRAGSLPAGGAISPLPASHLDDLLATVVLYRGETPVPLYSLSFESVLPEEKARALARLSRNSNDDLHYFELLSSLKGERVELTLAHRIRRGRLVGLAPLDLPPAGTTPPPASRKSGSQRGDAPAQPPLAPLPDFELTLLADGAAIERYHANEVQRIRVLDPTTRGHLERAIEATAGRVDQVRRVLKVLAQAGEDLHLAYVTEAPVWRASYRLRLQGAAASANLSGFGLVHNDTDEPWNSVTVEFSNDEPDSFLLALAAPRYWNRHLRVTRESRADPVPQLAQSSPDRLEPGYQPDHTRDSAPAEVHAAHAGHPPVSLIPAEHPVGIAAGRTSYTYRVPRPVSVPAHTSALLPFLDARVKAEQGVWFKLGSKLGRAVVRLENASSAPLPGGTVSVLDGEHFAGEAELPELEPGRFGYFDFGTELGVEFVPKAAPAASLVYRAVSWKDDSLDVRIGEREESPIEIHNATAALQTVFLPLNTEDGAVVTGADRVEPKGAGRPTVVTIRVPPLKTVTRTVVIQQERVDTYDVQSLELDLLETLVRQTTLPTANRAALKEAAQALRERKGAETRKTELEQEAERVQTRLAGLPVTDSSPRPEGPIAARYVTLEAEKAKLEQRVAEIERSMEAKGDAIKRALGKLR
jgi:hypothetical protein